MNITTTVVQQGALGVSGVEGGLAVPALVLEHCELSVRGARFEVGLGFEDWLAVGRKLCQVDGCVLFWLGDWMNHGNAAYGEKYGAALELFDYQEQTLRTAAWVAGRVKMLIRINNLSWSHHREVAELEGPEQAHWLGLAVRGTDGRRWTVSELRQAIRKSKATQPPEPDGGGLGIGFERTLGDFKRVIRQLQEDVPLSEWSQERRAAVKETMQPLVTFWEAL